MEDNVAAWRRAIHETIAALRLVLIGGLLYFSSPCLSPSFHCLYPQTHAQGSQVEATARRPPRERK